jgi:GNAT superfamily N-acetyltransferase
LHHESNDQEDDYMPDMLVKLYQLPPLEPVIEAQRAAEITIRRGIPPEKHVVLAWIDRNFRPAWVSECDVAFAHKPPGCFLAIENEAPIGFACYDTTRKGFFGPVGVLESARGRDTGRALLLACLHDMYAQGYGYAIIGAAGPVDYYRKVAGAIPIEDSSPGVYDGMLRE